MICAKTMECVVFHKWALTIVPVQLMLGEETANTVITMIRSICVI